MTSRPRAVAVARAECALAELAHGRKTIGSSALAELGIAVGPSGGLGRSSFNATSEPELTLDPTRTIFVQQGRVRAATVSGYLAQWQSFGELPAMLVTDRPGQGTLWHLDGLHRLIAARLVGQPLTANLWR